MTPGCPICPQVKDHAHFPGGATCTLDGCFGYVSRGFDGTVRVVAVCNVLSERMLWLLVLTISERYVCMN